MEIFNIKIKLTKKPGDENLVKLMNEHWDVQLNLYIGLIG